MQKIEQQNFGKSKGITFVLTFRTKVERQKTILRFVLTCEVYHKTEKKIILRFYSCSKYKFLKLETYDALPIKHLTNNDFLASVFFLWHRGTVKTGNYLTKRFYMQLYD